MSISTKAEKRECPQCGQQSLIVQPLSDGTTELACVELDCDFADVVTSFGAITDSRHDKTSFSASLAKLTIDQLERMVTNLENSVGHLEI